MYSSKSYRKGPGEPHTDNNQKQSTRSSRSQFKVSKRLNKNPYGSTKSSRIEKNEGDCEMHCEDCYQDDDPYACDKCDECEGGGVPIKQAMTYTAEALNCPQEMEKCLTNKNCHSCNKFRRNCIYSSETVFPPSCGELAVAVGPSPVGYGTAIDSVVSAEGYGTAIAAWGPEACDRESNKCFSGLSGSNDCNACVNFSLNCNAKMGLEYPPSCGNYAIKRAMTSGPSAVGYGTAIDSVVSAEGYGTAIKTVEHVCPPCGNDSDDDMVPVLRNQVAALRQELDRAKLKGLTKPLRAPYRLKDIELFNLVNSFLVPPTHAYFDMNGAPKTLFKTQSLVCGKRHGGVRFLAIHENIISNQFRLGRQKMKFFGYKVKGWGSNMSEQAGSLSDATAATCLHGEHTIHVMHEELESIKIRYVRRFFYVYYGLVVKEIAMTKMQLMASAQGMAVLKARMDRNVRGDEASAIIYEDFKKEFDRRRENFFGGAIPYHLGILRKLNDELIKLGGIQNHIEDALFWIVQSQESHFEGEIQRLSNMNIALVKNQNYSPEAVGDAPDVPMDPTESWFLPAPPSASETERFKTLAKAVISTLIADQAPPQLFYEAIFGQPFIAELVEFGKEIGINIGPTTKWSVIIQALVVELENEAVRNNTSGPSFIKSQIMTWGSYILRHMQNEEEWIISKMGELLSGGKYSNSEGVIMASQFLTILGKSVGLTRAQAVQEVQEASERVNDLTDNTASLNEQITDLQAHIRGLETEVRNMEDGAAAEMAEKVAAVDQAFDAMQIAEAANNTLQNISTSWAHFMGSIGGDIPYPTSLNNAPISSEIDYVKTELVKKLDEMKTLKERLASGTEDLEKARADLSTAQAEVTRLDGELIKTNVSLEDALANPDCSAAEASVRELLSGNIVALEDQIDTKTVLLKTRLDKITELEKKAVSAAEAVVAVADEKGAVVKKVEKQYKKKIEDIEETSAAAIKQKNMIIIGLAIFILILIIVVIVK